MNRKGLYIILFFISLGLNDIFCQGADSLQFDTNTYSIVLNCIPTFDGSPLDNGDGINVRSNITDTASQENSISYQSDSLNTLALSNRILVDSSFDSTDLEFWIQSKRRNCISSKVQYITDEKNSSESVISISSFQAENHIIDFRTDVICSGDDPVAPYTDIPDNNFVLKSYPEGLKIGRTGAIIPRESLPGVYMLNFSSEYCLPADSVIVEIVPSPDLALEDTISICRGTGLSSLKTDVSDIQFYISGSTETIIAGDVSENGDYIAVSERGPCASVDTVYIGVIESPEILWDLREECDRVVVNTLIPETKEYSVSWSNNVEGPENTVYSDTILKVAVENEAGCTVTDSIEITVNKLEIRSVDYQQEEADCWTDGQMIINTGEVDNFKGNYRFRLHNQLTNQLLSNLDEVPEGVYTLQVVDDRDCVADYEKTVKVEQKCLEDYPAFSPDGDNIEDNYFIPHEGTVSIYNRNGRLLQELETPAYWDGTDAQGNLQPMGNYLLITESGRTVNITIIR